ncbi:Alkylated DNA repair protein (DNA oxidative demethylase) OS=Castellaniella defragrans OX=75697 GN=HNR28_000366 PE=4 SV=1 [Castellaniella defragrans]
MTSLDLFGRDAPGVREAMGHQAWICRRLALPYVEPLLAALAEIEAQAPFRHMDTPNGYRTNAALTNCGVLGWTSDREGYRYGPIDPQSGRPWPPMPETFLRLAREAARAGGFDAFEPDACLINDYRPESHLSLHQDKNERDFSAPIVSVSLGMSALFLFGGATRGAKAFTTRLHHGDVAVWGGVDRLRFHGVQRLEGPPHPRLGARRINLTFRKAG